MFVGHYAAAIAARAVEPKAPFWALVGAAQLVDIGWAGLVMAGVERASIDEALPGSALVLEHMPWTHSLPGALVWSLAAGLAALALLKTGRAAALLIGAVVFSHWLLDLLVHRPDLALWPGGPKVGLGLWNFPVPEQAVEIGLVALAALAWGASLARRGVRLSPAAAFLVLLLAVQIAAMLTPLSPEPAAMGGSALAVYLLVTLLAIPVDPTNSRS